MATAKEAALELIKNLPDEASWDDIMREMDIKQKIEQGLLDIENGRTVPHEAVKERVTQGKHQAV